MYISFFRNIDTDKHPEYIRVPGGPLDLDKSKILLDKYATIKFNMLYDVIRKDIINTPIYARILELNSNIIFDDNYSKDNIYETLEYYGCNVDNFKKMINVSRDPVSFLEKYSNDNNILEKIIAIRDNIIRNTLLSIDVKVVEDLLVEILKYYYEVINQKYNHDKLWPTLENNER